MATISPTVPALELYLAVLAGSAPAGRFFDVRWRSGVFAMRRRFLAASDASATTRLISRLGETADVYVGVALRNGCVSGGRRAISGSHLVWVESDNQLTGELIAHFRCRPTLMIASGTPGHLQLYWHLDRPYPLEHVEHANRTLAAALAGDRACADGARILRPPGTLNHKHEPPRAVQLLRAARAARYSLAELTRGLPHEVGPTRAPAATRSAQRTGRTGLERQLLAVPAADYVRVLAGLTPNGEGKVRCPFHDDQSPSLQLYPDGSFFCFGSSCRRGGSIYDFASHLWGITPRGLGFLQISGRLASTFSADASGRR